MRSPTITASAEWQFSIFSPVRIISGFGLPQKYACLPVAISMGKLSPADRIILRQDGIHRVVIQRRPIAVDAALPCGKDDVGAPRLQQLERLKLLAVHGSAASCPSGYFNL